MYGVAQRAGFGQPVERGGRGGTIERSRFGIVCNGVAAGRRACKRLHSRDRSIQRVQCLDAHASRIGDDLPAFLPVAIQCFGGSRSRDAFVRRLRNLAALRSPQGLQHAILHFCGCLARKRYRNDLLRRIDRCQQPKVALDQEFGLTGTGRGLHDEGTGHVQRLATGPFVGGEQFDIMRHAVTLRNEKGY